jgi:hypothetical protein
MYGVGNLIWMRQLELPYIPLKLTKAVSRVI